MSLQLDTFGPLWLEWAVGLLLLSLWGFSILSTRAQALPTRIAVSLLRLVILGFTYLLLHQPTLIRTIRKSPERNIAVLIDRSGSMGAPEKGATRFEKAETVLQQIQDQEPKLSLYEFDQELYGPLPKISGANELTGKRTDFYQSLTQVLNKSQNISGIVVVSDGHDLGRFTAMDLDETRNWLKRLDAPPIHGVLIGNKSEGPEIAIHSIDAPSFSYVRAPLTIRATVMVRNLPEYPRQIQLLEGQNIIQVKDLNVDAQGFGNVQFEFYPETIGEHLYTVVVPPHRTESNTANNRQNILIDIGRDKISVLHIAGSITWDLQGLRSMFELNNLVDLTAFFIMRTRDHMQIGTDARSIGPDEMALVPFPTEEIFDRQLYGFDVIVFQDFDAGNYFNDSYQMRRLLSKIKSFIQEHHGALIVIGGPQSAAGPSLGVTPLADVMALVPPSYRVPYASELEKAVVTQKGKYNPILQGFEPDLHRFQGHMDRLTPNPKSEILLQTAQKAALLATLESGTGRTVFLNTSSSWKWYRDELEKGLTGSAYQAFWDHLIKWSIQDPSMNQVHLTAFKSLERPLDLDVEVLLRQKDYQPAKNVSTPLLLSSIQDPDQVYTANVQTNQQGQAQIKFHVAQPGYYRLSLPDSPWQELAEPQIVFLGGSQDEFGNQDPVPETLSRLANLTGGKLHESQDLDVKNWAWRNQSREEIIESNRLKLRNWVWGLPILLLLAAVEWYLRRTRYLA
ncbi:MAG: VWA domain-containing protein [Acidobacteria bacterium]|nr:VWA domain-containing protein [Acidobacteriota bacterium]MCB9399493.1 VWA domain-containing protein [Acidobacteriota bacterium]